MCLRQRCAHHRPEEAGDEQRHAAIDVGKDDMQFVQQRKLRQGPASATQLGLSVPPRFAVLAVLDSVKLRLTL